MGLLTERYFGYDIPGWAREEDLDDYFMTIDEARARPARRLLMSGSLLIT